MMKQALTVAAIVVFVCSACAPARHQPAGPKADLPTLQKQLSETEKKVDALTQRVALIQIMVDSHQRALQDFTDSETTDKANTDLHSVSPVPEAEPAPVINQTSPHDTEMEEEVPVSEPASPGSTPTPQEAEPAQRPETKKKLTVPEQNPLYRKAMAVFRKGEFETAAGLFDNFARQFPKDDLADNALYWSGECRYTQKDYAGALKQFRQVIDDYPSGSKVPDALLKIGFAYLSLGDKESAVTYLKKVVANYPFSAAGAKAEERLKALQK